MGWTHGHEPASRLPTSSALSACGVQVVEVNGQDVVCTAQNDATLEGLLTVIHKEREAEFGMSSVQASALPDSSSQEGIKHGTVLPGRQHCKLAAQI